MRKTPMEIVLHTKKIPFKDFGNISMLGETLNTPLKRCKHCGVVPNVHYYNWSSEYTIEHFCKVAKEEIKIARFSYEDVANSWNERNK